MVVEAKPYKEGKGWAIRLRYKGNDIYLSGCKTSGEATTKAGKEVAHIDKHGQPAWGGPKGKTVGLALQRHAAQTLRFKKGGDQEARRINRYLRHAGLDEIVLAKLPGTEVHEEEVTDTGRPKGKDSTQKKTERVYFKQEWRPAKTDRDIPNSLRQHRQLLTVKTADSDRIRAQIARTQFTQVTTDLLQSFVAALVDEGTAPATVYQEIAILRQLFNHARRRWKWREPEANPASDLELPTIDNERDRVMSVEEQERLLEALANRRAKGVVELVTLPVHDWPTMGADLAALRVELACDGEAKDRGVASIVLDGPLHALKAMVEAMAKTTPFWAIRAGEVVTTGTITDAWPLAPGQRWSTIVSEPRLQGLALQTTE